MELIFTPDALADLEFWERSGNRAIQSRIQKVLCSIAETPFEGIGKPEPLKNEFSGRWSRRIDREHRVIYSVDEKVSIFSLRGHYKKR